MNVIALSPRPRERCLQQGATQLSLTECLTLILGSGPAEVGASGVAAQLVARLGGDALYQSLDRITPAGLQNVPGLGPAQRARILAAFELARRYALHQSVARSRAHPSKPSRWNALPEQALDQIDAEHRFATREWLGFVPCWRSPSRSRAGEFCRLEWGSRTHVNFDPAELFAQVLALRPNAFFLFHNHPSGDLTPSQMDLDLTAQVREVARRLGTPLLGHGIIAGHEERWVTI